MKRCLTKQEAADYCGCNSLSTFNSWIAKGIIPGAIPNTNRWDKKAIDVALDRASKIVSADKPGELNAYQKWKRENAKTHAA